MTNEGARVELLPAIGSLSDRDEAILLDLARVRVLSGGQLTRLHFSELTVANRERARRRVLNRLIEHHFVATLERRSIGGVRAGSSSLIYALGTAGQCALPLLGADMYSAGPTGRVRTPWTPGSLFLATPWQSPSSLSASASTNESATSVSLTTLLKALHGIRLTAAGSSSPTPMYVSTAAKLKTAGGSKSTARPRAFPHSGASC